MWDEYHIEMILELLNEDYRCRINEMSNDYNTVQETRES